MIDKLSLLLCEDLGAWESFIKSSLQGSRYALPKVLQSLGCETDFWFICKSGRPVAAIPIVTSCQTGGLCPVHAYYIGLMYSAEIASAKENRKTEWELAISEFAASALSERYETFNLCLHPTITDIRGFDWFNYHTPEKGRAVISPQYTAIAELVSTESIREAARSSRRREEKYAFNRENLSFCVNGTAEELLNLYVETFKRQSSDVSYAELTCTANFINCVLDNDFGYIAVVRKQDGEAVSAGLVLEDYQGTIHLPVVGSGYSQYGGTLLYFNMMDVALKKGFKRFDFNGANSPKRGYFKHSIGGKAQLFFNVSWQKPKCDI